LSKRVLVVDDDAAIRRMVVAVLTREGYEVEEAATGQQALEEIAWDGYQAIVLDLMMPIVSGYDVLRAISNVRPHSRCVIIMSAAPQRAIDDVDASIVRAKLRKPFNIQELVGAVRSCVGDTDT
jgi:two-component system, response regulator, stage 0 sporulation protein F